MTTFNDTGVTYVPNALIDSPDLTPEEKLVLMSLIAHYDPVTKKSSPCLKTIAHEACQTEVDTVLILGKLKSAGHVQIEGESPSNYSYRILTQAFKPMGA